TANPIYHGDDQPDAARAASPATMVRARVSRCIAVERGRPGPLGRPRSRCVTEGQLLALYDILHRDATSVASLIGHLRSSTFRLSATAMSMSLTGSLFSSESAPRPFHHGIRGRGGTILRAALRRRWQVQATERTHLIHRPARDTIPPLGGARASSYWNRSVTAVMLQVRPLGSSGIRCRQP